MRDVTGFVAALDRLRTDHGLSFRQLETNARAAGAWLAHATANDVVKRGQLPTQQDPADFIEAWVRACGEDPEPWLATWRRLTETTTDDRRVPRQLPPDVPGFTGRTDALAALDTVDRDQREGPAIALITGTAGSGKTALAIRWAHQNAARFPDGQLHIDLRGFSHDPPIEPEQALLQFLQALGVPYGEIPLSLDARVGLYRSVIAGRRLLLVLDNAGDVRQIRPLLPATPGSAALVTSRDRLAGLIARDGARSVSLGRLDPDASAELITEVVGDERAAREPEALREIARLCEGLPLALRISAATLSAEPYLSLAEHAARLGADRLSVLEIPGDTESAIRAAFALSYQRLGEPAKRLFRMLGLAPVADFSPPVAAALAGQDPPPIAELTTAHLAEAAPDGRFHVHDLLRGYAAERAETEDTPHEREAAAERLWKWYISHATGVTRRLHATRPATSVSVPWPDLRPVVFPGNQQALLWLEAERANIIALARHAAEHGPRIAVWHLHDLLRSMWFVDRDASDLIAVAEAALAAAYADDHHTALALSHHSLQTANWRVANYAVSLEHAQRAMDHYRKIGNAAGEGAMSNNIALMLKETGRLAEAEEYGRRAAAFRDPDYVHHQALFQTTLSEILTTAGRFGEALKVAEATQDLAEQEVEDRRVHGDCLLAVAEALAGLGRTAEAERAFLTAEEHCEAVGYRRGLADVNAGLAEAMIVQGRLDEAVRHAELAVDLAKETSHRLGEGRAMVALGRALALLGEGERGANLARQAADLHHRYGQPLAESAALAALQQITAR